MYIFCSEFYLLIYCTIDRLHYLHTICTTLPQNWTVMSNFCNCFELVQTLGILLPSLAKRTEETKSPYVWTTFKHINRSLAHKNKKLSNQCSVGISIHKLKYEFPSMTENKCMQPNPQSQDHTTKFDNPSPAQY